MKLTHKDRYALNAVLELAMAYGNGVVTIQELSTKIRAPKKFLEQVLLQLKRGGFVDSRRGQVGGYFLSRPPKEIRVSDIVQFVDGPIGFGPHKERSNGDDHASRLFQHIWDEVNQATLNILSSKNFEELAKQRQVYEEAISYSI